MEKDLIPTYPVYTACGNLISLASIFKEVEFMQKIISKVWIGEMCMNYVE